MKCLNCDNERNGRSKYCSDSCKVAYNRNKKRNTVTEKSVTPETVTHDQIMAAAARGLDVVQAEAARSPECVSSQDKIILDAFRDEAKTYSRSQLMSRIRAYSGDSWIRSFEFEELMRRLRAWSIDKLEGLGYFIPAWKRCA